MTDSVTTYLIGFVLSLLLTLAAYALLALHVANHHAWPSHAFIIPAVLLLALIQLLVQAVFFLHLSFAPEARLQLVLSAGAFAVVLILVGGSIWIMQHLNERMLSDQPAMQQYMDSQSGL
jgi:cytochrome o ubiquinol oxidase operon protein cyoD